MVYSWSSLNRCPLGAIEELFRWGRAPPTYGNRSTDELKMLTVYTTMSSSITVTCQWTSLGMAYCCIVPRAVSPHPFILYSCPFRYTLLPVPRLFQYPNLAEGETGRL